MKSLYLVRHAKSSWKNHNLNDKERPLKKRGEKNARLMSKILKKGENIPELIISSPAARALRTAEIFVEKLDIPDNSLKTDEKLYMADYYDFINVITQIPSGINKAMIIGHNPGLTFLACTIGNSDIDTIPTCGVVRIDIDINSWNDFSAEKGKMIFFEYPKKFDLDVN